MDLNRRKKELEGRITQLRRETDSTIELVKLLVVNCEKVVENVCSEERHTFVTNYPSVIETLDSYYQHVLRFNCSTDILISKLIDTLSIGYLKNTEPIGCNFTSRIPVNTTTPTVPDVDTCNTSVQSDPKSAQDDGLLSPTHNEISENVSNHSLDHHQINDLINIPKPTQSGTMKLSEENVKTVGCSEQKEVKKSHMVNASTVTSSHRSTPSQEDKLSRNKILSVSSNGFSKDLNGMPKEGLVKNIPESSLNCTSQSSGDDSIIIGRSFRQGYPGSVGKPAKVGDSCTVMLSHIESPGEFYVHITCKENASFDDFHIDLNEFYSKNKLSLESKLQAEKKMGKFGVCYFPEIKWCRVQIIDWHVSDEFIKVQLVDYGDVYNATLEMIQPILKKYFQQPLFATRCHLGFIEPPSHSTTWPPESTKFFMGYMPPTSKENSRTALSFDLALPNIYKIIKAEKSLLNSNEKVNNLSHQASLSVILSEANEGKLNLNDRLVELGFASIQECFLNVNRQIQEESLDQTSEMVDRMRNVEQWLNAPDQHKIVTKVDLTPRPNNQEKVLGTVNDSLEKWNPMKEDYINSAQCNDSAVLAVSGYEARDESRICRFYAATGKCRSGLNCRMEHSLIHPDGYTTDQELIFIKTFTPLNMPSEGSQILLKITHIPEHQKYFYGTIEPDICEQSEEETIFTLIQHINDSAKVKTYKTLVIPPALGQIVLALSKEDGKWHRGRVVEEHNEEDHTDQVFFVDFGWTETVSANNVRLIESFMLHLPFQAIECHIANVEFNEHSSNTFAQHFRLHYLGHSLPALVTTSLQETQVMYCLLHNMDGEDIGQLLVNIGVGSYKDSWNVRHHLIPA